jgi:NYN domain-containing protein
MTDVQIATQLLADAFLDRFDSAVVISADSDLIPPIRAVMTHFPHQQILVAFPPERTSLNLRSACNSIQIWPRTVPKCLLPDPVRNDGRRSVALPGRMALSLLHIAPLE